MKSVLMLLENDRGMETRLQASLDIVRVTEGHLTLLYTTPLSKFVGLDPFGGSYVLPSVIDALDKEEADTRSRIEARLASEGVNWTYLSATDEVSHGLVRHAALNDLVVLSRPSQTDRRSVFHAMIADIVMGSPSPVLVMPEGKIGFDVAGSAAIAWNGSFEAANALRAALPLLRRASSVSLISVEEEADEQFPLTTASEYLSRHGVKSDLVARSPGSMPVNEALLKAVGKCQADYLVMGAFGHSRAREYWLGGVTRSLIYDAPVPIVFGR